MGTRNLTIVHKNGEYKVAQYGQWDGYPEGLGATLLNFLKNVNMDSFRNAIDNVSFYTQEELEEIDKQIDEARKVIPNYEWQRYYPHLSRDCGGDILNRIVFKGVTKVKNAIDFAADSLFCEWAYVIDLDTNKFEVYKGFNKEELSSDERFYCMEEKRDKENDILKNYHPIKFVKSYDLNNLPDEKIFIAELTPDNEDEEQL